jgi:competence protein ComEA
MITHFQQPFYRLSGSAWRAASAALVLGACTLLGGGPVVASAAEPVEVTASSAAVAEAANTAAVSINSADAQQLAAGLVGVGMRKAEAIVRYREQFGPFTSIDELAEVSGIGAATVERNRANIRLD